MGGVRSGVASLINATPRIAVLLVAMCGYAEPIDKRTVARFYREPRLTYKSYGAVISSFFPRAGLRISRSWPSSVL